MYEMNCPLWRKTIYIKILRLPTHSKIAYWAENMAHQYSTAAYIWGHEFDLGTYLKTPGTGHVLLETKCWKGRDRWMPRAYFSVSPDKQLSFRPSTRTYLQIIFKKLKQRESTWERGGRKFAYIIDIYVSIYTHFSFKWSCTIKGDNGSHRAMVYVITVNGGIHMKYRK